ncbi:MAG TPA: glycosyltransferase family 39 protein [Dehalococcoidia bacterium]|nr:glycosyltransferase family 39 protein [Dehalococcoidia bacterium]
MRFVPAALALAALPVLIRLPYLAEPFDTDEGGYAYIARALLDGQVPYRDAWDNKPPLTFFAYAAAIAVSDRPEAIRLLAAVVVALATLLLIGLGREAFDRRTGLLAGAIFVLATATPRLQGTNANTEIFLLPGWIAGSWVILVGLRTGARWTWPLAGAQTGVAILAKPVAGWLLIALAATLALLIARRGLSLRSGLGRMAAFAAGLTVALLPVGVYFAAHQALGEALHAVVWFNRLYLVRNLTFALDQYGLGAMLFAPNREVVLDDPFIWLFGLVGLVTVPSLRCLGGARTAFLVAWSIAGYLGAKTGWLELPHYYLQLVPPLALWSAAYLTRALPAIGKRKRRTARLIGLVGAGLLLWTLAAGAPAWLAGSPERFHELKFPFPDRGAWDTQATAIAAELRGRTSPGESVFIWGREPQIYYYAGRRSASRYIHDRPAWIEAGVIERIRADLAAARPRYVLDTLDPIFFPEATRPAEAILPPGYREAGRWGFARVFERID